MSTEHARIRRWLVGAWLVLMTWTSCLGCAAPQVAKYRGRDVSARYASAVAVRVLCTGPENALRAGWGSGVIIGPRSVVTAAHVPHCPDGMKSRSWIMYGNTSREAVLAEQDEVMDVARLELVPEAPDMASPRVTIGRPPAEGDIVCLYPGMPSRDESCGRVMVVRSEREWTISAGFFAVSGNSGSGVYDERGYLVGVVVTRYLFQVGGTATSLYAAREVLQ